MFMLFAGFGICWYGPAWGLVEVDLSLSAQVRDHLQSRLETMAPFHSLMVHGTRLHMSATLQQFYARRRYEPAWSDDMGPTALTEVLQKSLAEAWQDGLKPEDYHQSLIATLLKENRQVQGTFESFNPARLADLDLFLTDAFLIYGSHLLSGRVNPETIHAQWYTERRQGNLAQALQQALESKQIDQVLQTFRPPQPEYYRLKWALGRYRAIAAQGGWPKISAGGLLQLGERDRRVVILRKRLHLGGDLGATAQRDADVFDASVERAVRRFQSRHGLTVDGIVGPLTLEALNIPVQQRLQQLRANLERWRWLPHDLGRQRIVVNIARFTLDVMEDEQAVMSMRIIVGKPYRDTPVFSSNITYLVLNPSWNVPSRIAVEDKLPIIRQDPGYLARHHMKLFRGWGTEAREIDPGTVNWSKVSAEKFPYRLRQTPGPLNALGHVKFVIPNRFDVYLHDTPSRELFNHSIRTFSSGCIRIEKPVALAEYVLRGNPKWNHQTLLASIHSGREQAIRVPTPIPVHLLYMTAWVESDGTVHFREDIYQRDALLENALSTALLVPQPVIQ
jgi:murein L,D-transpeptidase YcbB/YkuD